MTFKTVKYDEEFSKSVTQYIGKMKLCKWDSPFADLRKCHEYCFLCKPYIYTQIHRTFTSHVKCDLKNIFLYFFYLRLSFFKRNFRFVAKLGKCQDFPYALRPPHAQPLILSISLSRVILVQFSHSVMSDSLQPHGL